MKASVIIPTYNGANKIVKLLSDIESQINDDIQIIIVIDGSTDNTFDLLKNKGLKISNFDIINQENKGRAGARNAGAAIAKGEILIFFDDDIIVTQDLIKGHIYEQESKDIVVGFLESFNQHSNSEMLAFSNYLNKKWNAGVFENERSEPYITAANFSIKKDLFKKFNGFDYRLNDSEDLDLAIRLTGQGYDISHVKNLIAQIPLNENFADNFKRLKEYKIGREKFYSINPEAKKTIDETQGKINFLKKIFFFFFSFPFLIKLVDMGFFTFLPEKWRFKIYDWMMTANMIF